MNYTVKNDKGAQVGKTFDSLDEATAFIELNNGYSKGWYLESLNESSDTGSRPQYLTEA